MIAVLREKAVGCRRRAIGLTVPVKPDADHIPLRRLWRARSGVEQLPFSEYAHVIDCEKCRAAFRACVRNENFEAAEKDLGDETG